MIQVYLGLLMFIHERGGDYDDLMLTLCYARYHLAKSLCNSLGRREYPSDIRYNTKYIDYSNLPFN